MVGRGQRRADLAVDRGQDHRAGLGHLGRQVGSGGIVGRNLAVLVGDLAHEQQRGDQGQHRLGLAQGHHHVVVAALAPAGAHQPLEGAPQGVVLLNGVGGGVVDQELSADPRHVDQHLSVLVGDHAPRIARIGHAVGGLDFRAAGLQLAGQLRQPLAFAGGPVTAR